MEWQFCILYIYIFKKCSFDQIFCFGVRFFCWNRIIRFCVSSCECPLCSHYQTMRSVICVDCIVRKKLFSSFSIGIFIFAVELCQTWKLHMFQCWAFRPFFFLSFSLIAVKLFKPHRNRWVPFIFDFFTTFSIFFLFNTFYLITNASYQILHWSFHHFHVSVLSLSGW